MQKQENFWCAPLPEEVDKAEKRIFRRRMSIKKAALWELLFLLVLKLFFRH
ncbi:MAG: hypothetical protein AB7V25_09450 [Mangrovibacterium sp.]